MTIQTDLPCTRRQRWYLFILTKDPNWWDEPMSMAEAGQRIKEAEANKRLSKVSTSNHNLVVWREAIQAGKLALEASKPTPMLWLRCYASIV